MSKSQQSPSIRGVGWIADGSAGSLRSGPRALAADITAADARPPDGLFGHPVRNWNRFDPVSRLVCSLCALALADADIADADGRKTATGLLLAHPTGCLAANRAYWQDYLDAGRQMARGNLFVYTLPSSPLAEAAIHFGFQGPLLFIGGPGSAAELMQTAARWIRSGEMGRAVAVDADDRSGLALVIAPAPPSDPRSPEQPQPEMPAAIARRLAAAREVEKTW